jgi:hypothetical protein
MTFGFESFVISDPLQTLLDSPKMEIQQDCSSPEEQHPIDYHSDKSSNFKSVIADTLEKDNESQISENEISIFRLVLTLAALWVCPMPQAPSIHHKSVSDKVSVRSFTLSLRYFPTVLQSTEEHANILSLLIPLHSPKD